jgi:glucose-1-phosphate thymidylyltransferase
MKGIILAAGAGTRLYPSTLITPKPLLSVYDKPMVYYPLSVLMLAGITEILIISAPGDRSQFQRLLGDGSQWGISLNYGVQPSPDGIAQAYTIGAEYLCGSSSALMLGDNLFYGHGLGDLLRAQISGSVGATVFVHAVNNPERYGIIELDGDGRPVSLEEKPLLPRSNWAVTGLYLCDGRVIDIAANLKPSRRGELEIADVIRTYLEQGLLRVKQMDKNFDWFDMGTPDSLLAASSFVQALQNRQGLLIACPEEIAFNLGLITHDDFVALGRKLEKCSYGQYLLTRINNALREIDIRPPPDGLECS